MTTAERSPSRTPAPATTAAPAALGVVANFPSRWITREHPQIDRIACPWLIRRFVDAQARFFWRR